MSAMAGFASSSSEELSSLNTTTSSSGSPDTEPADSADLTGEPIHAHSDSDSPGAHDLYQGGLGWRDQEDIVISGVSGRFPCSDTMEELRENLYNGVDMVTEDNSRWEPGLYGNPRRHGKVRTWAKFDNTFFGIPPKQVNMMDPQLRNLLHASYEAIIDAGLNPKWIRGSRTGVFVGSSGSESLAALTRDPDLVQGWSMSGCTGAMFPNRISYSFDFKGPSFTIDTACNSSLLALQVALTAMRDGQCDKALVCGANATLTATNCLQFTRLGVLSTDGKCKSFDADGSGYAKSEGIGALFLQRSSEAFRVYATLIHARSSTDGWKEEGVHFPSGESQGRLLRQVYTECGVDPANVSYMEAHGTGTKVGDPQEVNSIADIFCPPGRRSEPLKMGSVKSNMGHCEPASGVASVAKVLLAMETGLIPPNLHYNTPNPSIPGLTDGRITVIDKTTPWEGGYVGINSFGFGGANTHVLLKSNNDESRIQEEEIKIDIPKLFCFPGRTEAGLDLSMEKILEHKDNHHFYCLMANLSQAPTSSLPHRGFILFNRKSGEEPTRLKAKNGYERRPLWLILTGMGAQWMGMGLDLMAIHSFRDSVLKSSEVVRPLGCDPYSQLLSTETKNLYKNVRNSIVNNITIQIALVDMLRELGLEWDGIVGHSTGEIPAAYADGALTREQTMLLAYYRGEIILQGALAPGGMAAVGLTWEEAERRLAGTHVVPACHNGADSVSISGPAEAVTAEVAKLEVEGIFAREVDSSGIPFHSPAMSTLKEKLLARFKEIIPSPKARSQKWVSSSVLTNERESWKGFSGAEYHVNNIVSPVRFHEAISNLPEKAVTLEIGPHALLAAILRRTLPAPATHIGMMSKKASSNLDHVLESLGKLYTAGMTVHFERLYPAISWPVPRGTPAIASLMRWEDPQDWLVCCGSGSEGGNGSGANLSFDPYSKDSDEDAFLLDHQIDGRPLFPFTGYPVMAWRTLCKARGREMADTPVVFTDLRVYRPTILSAAVKFSLNIVPESGLFEVMEGSSMVASGYAKLVPEDEEPPAFYKDLAEEPLTFDPETKDPEVIVLKPADIYQEFLLRGYEYGPKFRGIHSFADDATQGLLHFDPEAPNWVTFLDALLQTTLVAERGHTLRLPVRIRYLSVNPKAMGPAVHYLPIPEEEEKEEKEEETDEKEKAVVKVPKGIPVIPVRTHRQTNGLCAGGVELRDLTVQTAQRRQGVQNLFLEKSVFVPFFETKCFQEPYPFPNVQHNATLHGDRIGQLLSEALTLWSEAQPAILSALPFGPHLGEILADLKSAGYSAPEPREGVIAPALASVLTELGGLAEVAKPEAVVPAVAAAFANALGDKALHDDAWFGVYTHQRTLKALMDLMMENQKSHLLRILMVEPAQLSLHKLLGQNIRSHPLTDAIIQASFPKEKTPDEETLAGMEVLEADWSLGGVEVDKDEAFNLVLLDRRLCKVNDIPRYLAALTNAVHEDGFLLVNEVTSHFARNAALDILTGGVEDLSFDGARKHGLYMEKEQWEKIFSDAGFSVVSTKADPCMDTTMFMLRKRPETPFHPLVIDCDDVEGFSWVPELQEGIKNLEGEPMTSHILLFSPALTDNGLNGLLHCFREENQRSNRIRGIFNISLDSNTPPLDLADPAVADRANNLDLVFQAYRDGVWGLQHHILIRDAEKAAIVETEHAYLNNLVQGDLNSFAWIQNPNAYFKPTQAKDMCIISLYYSALNFRDVMLATGRLTADAIPGDFASRECVLGSEFSGRISEGPEAGRRVMGMVHAQALATDVVCERRMCLDFPDEWSLEQAATIPAVYTTAYYALMVRARVAKGDAVLIHSGSGGVGQAAISICLSLGCEVFTTCSTPEKKAFLQQRFPELKDRHFSNSRSTDFEFDVLKATRGRGVDIVLNSLSEDKLMASVRCLAEFGRFLEIGKFDLANDSKLGMSVFLKNIQFHGILVDGLTENRDWNQLFNYMNQGIKDGVVQPLPTSLFPKEKVEDAFRFMAQGKHIGKVLVEMRAEETDRLSLPVPLKVGAVRRVYCDPEHNYLLTGGLGGFGLQVANWLVNRGARHLILTSRSGAKTGFQRRLIKSWQTKGVSVTISKLNVGDPDEARQLIQLSTRDRPLGGLFHLAMVLRDALFENQTVQNFKESAMTKYWGTKYLDRETRSLCGPELRYWVVFSSVTSGRGNGGQTNYGWANSTMERVAEQRQKDGLPATAIQWGAIGDVGVILNSMGNNSTVVGGTLPQRIPSCLVTLDELLGWETGAAVVGSFIRADTARSSGGGSGNLLETIARIIGVELDTIDEDAPFSDLGLDSLMGMEIKQAVEREANVDLSMKEVTSLTLKKLKGMIKKGGGSSKSTKSASDMDMVSEQLLKIFKLRVDASDADNDDIMRELNDVASFAGSGKPNVYFVHTMEGVATPLKELAAAVSAPVYCLQSNRAAPRDSIPSMALHYVTEMRKRQPEGPYIVVGYSYGACIAFEMGVELERQGEKPTILLLDSSHHYMKTYRAIYRAVYKVEEKDLIGHPDFETEMMMGLIERFTTISDKKEMRARLYANGNWEERVSTATEEVLKGGIFKDAETFAWIANSIHARYVAGDKYIPSTKFSGDITLVRAETGVAKEIDLGADYGLGEVVEGNVDVVVLPTDHEGIALQAADQTAAVIHSKMPTSS